MFLTGKEIEGKGTGFIELQYCKRNLHRLIALNRINHWEKIHYILMFHVH